jgi:hypothetical protein
MLKRFICKLRGHVSSPLAKVEPDYYTCFRCSLPYWSGTNAEWVSYRTRAALDGRWEDVRPFDG